MNSEHPDTRRGFLRRLADPGRRRPEPPGPPTTPLRLHIGAACLMRHRVECRLCAEACDTRAVRVVPAVGGVAQLRLDPSACTGCGDCVAPCPVGAALLGPVDPDDSAKRLP
ncbi:4Fe-4S dicluster domain-containing protein [Sphaerotilus uruguayifluvii]|uniref:NAD-dependent dihydropyrimidine dehydrogenase PreA subunit n=1 Tax=Sphaerotilus uruguayifluvii TaxID=2735897 RepID=A0ABX2FY88_9BURK|nr:4Fe-4S dicluster domain-containing protein [Leptothrix sp. C29]NRT54986.1 NAD-dependent dihydropyrimidine dehydrogenase PreA subunit [Leptothrix sp. C29]